MRLILKVLDGTQAGTDIKVPGPKFLIGRGADCHLRPNSDLISRHHCILLIEQGYVGVRDFGSKNGTFVNGERIASEVELKEGDELSVGQLRFGVHLETKIGGSKRPKVKDMKEAVSRTASMASGDDVVSDWLEENEEGADTDTKHALQLDTESLKASDQAGDTTVIPEPKKEDEGPKGNTQTAALEVLKKLAMQKAKKAENKDKQPDKK